MEAEPLYQRALRIYEKTLGSDHPDLAIVLNNLAVIYQTTGRPREAEPLFLRAMAIMTKLFGPDHPSVVTLQRNVDEMRKKNSTGSKADLGEDDTDLTFQSSPFVPIPPGA